MILLPSGSQDEASPNRQYRVVKQQETDTAHGFLRGSFCTHSSLASVCLNIEMLTLRIFQVLELSHFV